jgi:filamentous hemagglutinin
LAGKHKDIILTDGTKARVVFDKKGFPIFDDVAKYDTRLPNEAFHSASYKGQIQGVSQLEILKLTLLALPSN